jgi:RNA polymerase sigma factor (sigma-70 family)
MSRGGGTGIASEWCHLPASSQSDVEAALVQRAANGETAAFRLLLERYQGDVYRCCLHWLGDREDAQELCQDAFIKAWQALPDYEHRGRFRAWVIRIALNLCRDRVRSRGAGQERLTISLEVSEMEAVCIGLRPDDASVWRSDLEKLTRGLEALTEGLRLPLLLCGVEGLSQEECAEVIGISARAVEGRIHRARKQLLTWWEKND